MKILLILSILTFIITCNGQEKEAKDNHRIIAEKQNTAVVEFIDYRDEYNEPKFVTRKGNQTFSLIFTDDNRGNFNRGDELKIQWTNDSNNDSPFLISAKKIKDGSLSIFLKENPLRLQYTWKYECDGGFISKSYAIVEYYFSVTKNQKAQKALIDFYKNDKEKEVKIGNKIFDYIIEKENTLGGKKLILLNIGIFTYGGIREKIQDVYYESATNTLYELNQNKITEIK